jgi:hypothetical protein
MLKTVPVLSESVSMQVNSSYYSAVGNQDDWYVLARAIQFFTPGIPLVYYVGMLAGGNDVNLVEETKTGRDINRHPYDLQEAIAECDRPVVKVCLLRSSLRCVRCHNACACMHACMHVCFL